MRSTLAFCALALTAASLAACGGGGHRPPGPGASGADDSGVCLLGAFSRKADGSVSRADLDAGIKAGFARADANGDGALDFGETARLNDAKTGTCDVTPFIDWSGTGRIGLDNYGARYLTAFDQADVNEDGVATVVEMQTSVRKPPRPQRVIAPEPSV